MLDRRVVHRAALIPAAATARDRTLDEERRAEPENESLGRTHASPRVPIRL
jgi:hypothetical protein